ncbi:MAG: HD domain-containing protein [Candidatus Paceibacterota bacterium]
MDSPSKDDVALIKKATTFAEEAHKDIKRKSGEPYFNHVFETAKTLASFKTDSATIAAGLLHDSIEDGVATEEEIKKGFGDEILFLVNGVTKLGKVKYRGAERHIESLRKFMVAMSQDIRVLIIRLADRLHNMKTLQYVRPDKQKRIALETLEIYAPLAYRLSIRKLSRELEDLSFEYVSPEEYDGTVVLLKQKKDETLPRLEKFIKSVKKALAKERMTNIKTDYRQKGIYSLFQKLKSKGNDIEKVYDILALRVMLPDVQDCYKALGIIHGVWRPLPGRIKDYIAFPKPNGYQSLHTTVFTGDGSVVEVQIRTEEMHRNAEFGIASHISYKDSHKNGNKSSDIDWFRQFLPRTINFAKVNKLNNKKEMPEWITELADSQDGIKTSGEREEFLEDLKADFFCQRIFVFTPKGEVVDLPTGSSTLDFAYAIHSDVGDHASGAKINGKLVAMKTELNNGDIVEISTSKSSKPSSKWLEIVKTNMAKRHINNYLEKQKKK